MVLGGKDARLPPRQLEGRPYAVKRVTFSTAGYYASALSLVMREVRVLARLDHPNCVRHYTSWLEPSWMTGDSSGGGGEEGGGTVAPIEDDDCGERRDGVRRGYHAAHCRRRDVVDDIDGGGGGPKLLTDIERVVDGLHDVGDINDSVEQLEAILYGGRGGDGDGATATTTTTTDSIGRRRPPRLRTISFLRPAVVRSVRT